MADAIKLAAAPRERAGKGAARAARRGGQIPGVVYGSGQPPALIQLDPAPLMREAARAGFFTRLLDIDLGGKTERVLPRDIQFHPVTDRPEHVDFMRVTPESRIRVQVPCHFINQDKSPGLKRGGVLNVVRHAIEVYCRADSIPPGFDINLDGLDIGDSVHISAVKLPEGVRPTITGRDFTVASVAAPSVMKTPEEEAAEAAAKAAAEAAAAGVVPGAPAAPGASGAPGAAAPAAEAAPAADKKGAEKKGGDKKGKK